jgi:hypothetical protein
MYRGIQFLIRQHRAPDVAIGNGRFETVFAINDKHNAFLVSIDTLDRLSDGILTADTEI